MTIRDYATKLEDDFTSMTDEQLLEAIRDVRGDPELTSGLHRRIAGMCDACYAEAMYLLTRKHSQADVIHPM
jgi:hypothetical protein